MIGNVNDKEGKAHRTVRVNKRASLQLSTFLSFFGSAAGKMLTSAPRHLATVTFFTVCIIFTFLISPSQRLHTIQSTHELGEKFHSHSHNHYDHASTPDSSPERPDAAAHYHHSIVPTKAPVSPPPSTPSTTDDKESKESRFSSNEAPDTIDLEPTFPQARPAKSRKSTK